MTKLMIPLILLACLLGACASGGFGTEDAANMAKAAGGDSTSNAKSGDSNTPIALSQEGDAKNANVHAAATRTVSTSTAGHVQTGFTLAGNMGSASDALTYMAEHDPVLQELRAELAALRETESSPEARAAAIAAMEARMQSLEKVVAKAGGDVSGLTHLVVVNTMRNVTGGEEKPLTDVEAQAAAETIPKVIEAAREGQAAGSGNDQ